MASSEFASLAPTAAETTVQQLSCNDDVSYLRLLAYWPCFFTKSRDLFRDQKSYSNHTASHTTNHTAMTPPEQIAVQQSYNLLTAISLGGVRPLPISNATNW